MQAALVAALVALLVASVSAATLSSGLLHTSSVANPSEITILTPTGATFEFTNLNPLQYVSPDANVNSDGVTELAAMMAMSTFYGDADGFPNVKALFNYKGDAFHSGLIEDLDSQIQHSITLDGNNDVMIESSDIEDTTQLVFGDDSDIISIEGLARRSMLGAPASSSHVYCNVYLDVSKSYYDAFAPATGSDADKLNSVVTKVLAHFAMTATMYRNSFGSSTLNLAVSGITVHKTFEFGETNTTVGTLLQSYGTTLIDQATGSDNTAIRNGGLGASQSCLNHLFVHRNFGTTVGLAYTGSPNAGQGGGMCYTSTFTSNGAKFIANTAFTSSLSSSGTLSDASIAKVTAHEIGHNAASAHDATDDATCFPTGNGFIMAPSVQSGSNSVLLSSCSISTITTNVAANGVCLTAAVGQVCGSSPVSAPETSTLTSGIIGDVATLGCISGYTENAAATATCQSNGMWVKSATHTCTRKNCGQLTVTSGSATYAPSTLFGDTATLTCDQGYRVVGTPATATCQSTGSWSSIASWSCAANTCTVPTIANSSSVTNGADTAVTAGSSVATGSTIKLVGCVSGYVPAASQAVATCQLDGTWNVNFATSLAFQCTKQACTALSAATDNKQYSSLNGVFGDVVTLGCVSGFVPSNANLNVTCLATGLFEALPVYTCARSSCPGINVTNGAMALSQGAMFGDIVMLACASGYQPSMSPAPVATCQSNGTFTSTASWSCVKQSCALPTVANGGVFSLTAPRYLDTVTLTSCSQLGYQRIGPAVAATCLANGQWSTDITSGDSWTCGLVACSSSFTSSLPTNGAIVGQFALPGQFGQMVSLGCVSGYVASNTGVKMSCNAFGNWVATGGSYTCSRVNCSTAPVLPTNSNGVSNVTTGLFGDVSTLVCNTGYHAAANVIPVTCQASGSWSSAASWSCLIDTCVVPTSQSNSNLLNGVLSPTVPMGTAAPASGLANFGASLALVCNSGYQLQNPIVTATCLAGGAWSQSFASWACVKKSCSGLVAPASSSVDKTSGLFGDVATFSCISGYTTQQGVYTAACDATGTWVVTTPIVCVKKDCGALTVANGQISATTTTFGSTATFTSCSPGFRISGTPLVAVCQADAAWNATSWSCVANTCTVPTIANSSSVSDADDTAVTAGSSVATGSTIKLDGCVSGYVPAASQAVATCQLDGTWNVNFATSLAFQCTKQACTALSAATDNKQYSSLNGVFGDVVTLDCVSGYLPSVSNLAVTCQSSGEFQSIPTYVCNPVNCPGINVTNGAASLLQGAMFGDVVTLACASGYQPSMSPAPVATCQSSGTFTSTASWSCVKQSCTVPTIAQGTLSRTTAVFGDTLTLVSCSTGYHPSGAVVAQCLAGNTWNVTLSGAGWTCDPNECTASFTSALPTNGAIVGQFALPGLFGQMVSVGCVSGYVASNTGVKMSCNAFGNWVTTGGSYTCSRVNCSATLPTVTNGFANTTTGVLFGDVSTLVCNTGYHAAANVVPATCQADATWSTVASWSCLIDTCTIPSTPANGALSATVPANTVAPASGLANYQSSLSLTCDAGYKISGTAVTASCQAATGLWSQAFPTTNANWTCVKQTCTNVTVPPNAQSTATWAQFEGFVTLSCVSGYEPSAVGDYGVDCDLANVGDLNVQWIPRDTLTCQRVNCGSLPTDALGVVTANNVTTLFGDTATLTCNTGYHVDGPSSIATCRSDMTWSGLDACVIDTCVVPTVDSGVLSATTTTVNYQDTLTLDSCVDGYHRLATITTATCNPQGAWSTNFTTDDSFKCMKNFCTNGPVLPQNGTSNITSGLFGDVARLGCAFGFTADIAGVTATCQSDGTWAASAPYSCMINTCNSPPLPTNGLTPQASGMFNDVVQLGCTAGFHPDQGVRTVTCLSSGAWTQSTYKCVINACPVPPVLPSNGTFVTQVTNQGLVGTYACRSGSRVTLGSPGQLLTALCPISGVWPAPPTYSCPLVCQLNSFFGRSRNVVPSDVCVNP